MDVALLRSTILCAKLLWIVKTVIRDISKPVIQYLKADVSRP